MEGSVLELARQAAAVAATVERAARGPVARARLTPVRRYRGVERLKDGVYFAEVMAATGLRPVWLGVYATAEEAAHAYDAAARTVHGDQAQTNFPDEPPAAPAPALAPVPVAGAGGGAAPVAGARVVPPLLGHSRMRAAPVGGGAQREAFSVEQAPPAPHLGAPTVPYHGGAAPSSSNLLYRAAAGPAFSTAASGSNGACGFYGPALGAAAGGSDLIAPEPEEPMPVYAASSAFSSTDKESKAAFDASADADPDNLIITIDSDSDSDGESMNSNVTPAGDGGASTSSSPCPAVPWLSLKI